MYSYPVNPVLQGISGCSIAAPDTYSNLILATDCPTVGNVVITLYGANLVGKFDVYVGTAIVSFAKGNVFVRNGNSSMVEFLLPEGSGQALTVYVRLF
jgi:hypothetical protein